MNLNKIHQASVVRRLDNAIHWIVIYPVDSVIHLLNKPGQEYIKGGYRRYDLI